MMALRMRPLQAFFLICGAVLLQLHSAAAATTPQLLPESDVRVRYTVSVPGHPPHEYDLAFSAESERVRIDDPERGLWFMADLRNQTAALVVPAMHAMVTEPDLANLAGVLKSAEAAQFTPVGEARIAGHRCTRYRILSDQAKGTACLTHDGVTLAVSGADAHGSAQVIADWVKEGPVAPENFTAPPNFLTLALPPNALAALLGN